MLLGFRHVLIITGSLLTCSPALAVDPSCQPMLAAMTALRTKPFHMFMTMNSKYSTPAFARAATSIGAAGVKKSEEIWTGKNLYVLHKDKWIDMGNTFADPDNDSDDPDTKKAHDAERCTLLADDTVDGQAATVFKTHNAELGIDGKYWISKSSHLPIRSETTTVAGPMTTFSSETFTYDHVQAPANAMSLQDMIKRK